MSYTIELRQNLHNKKRWDWRVLDETNECITKHYRDFSMSRFDWYWARNRDQAQKDAMQWIEKRNEDNRRRKAVERIEIP